LAQIGPAALNRAGERLSRDLTTSGWTTPPRLAYIGKQSRAGSAPFIKRFGRPNAADVLRVNPRVSKSSIVPTDIVEILLMPLLGRLLFVGWKLPVAGAADGFRAPWSWRGSAGQGLRVSSNLCPV
jgi:hypothetical protein